MLTRADEYPIHQTPEPIAYSGTDRNFYDRYFFGAITPDASTYIGVAFGVYPHLDLADAHVAVVRDGVEHCVHASRHLGMERMDLDVGPISIEILEPLKRLRVVLAETQGLAIDLTFSGRAFPIEEPRFTHRIGPKVFMDLTRLTQNARVSGTVTIDGAAMTLPAGTVGTRDRSWGVRPIGAPDAQPVPEPRPPQFFWMWSPVNLADRSLYFHVNNDGRGRPWNTRSVLCPDGAAGPEEMVEVAVPVMDVTLVPGTRRVARAELTVEPLGAPAVRATYTPLGHFQMRGIGYAHPTWSHGSYHGPLEVEHEVIDLSTVDPLALHDLHVQALCSVEVEEEGRAPETVAAILEQFFVGPYEPLGLTGVNDPVAVAAVA